MEALQAEVIEFQVEKISILVAFFMYNLTRSDPDIIQEKSTNASGLWQINHFGHIIIVSCTQDNNLGDSCLVTEIVVCFVL